MQLDHLDWDDIRVFLTVLRSRSFRGAATTLGVSHPTVRRRVDALEERLGMHLFDRRPDGLHATDGARAIEEAAEDVERAMHRLSRRVLAEDEHMQGSVRVTLPEAIATYVLMPDLADFARRWPEIELHITADYGLADLSRREADVAVRLMRCGTLPDERLLGRKAGTVYRAVYGEGDSWLGWGGADGDWLKETPFPDLSTRHVIDNPELQLAACVAGMGRTLLPCVMADGVLEQQSTPEPAFDVWVLVHPDLKGSVRLRTFRDAIVDAIKRHTPRLEGRA